jgi:putative endonuclease
VAVPREPSGDPRQRLGREGEAAAAAALEEAGLRILERRFRCRLGEIDLVARDGEALVFVEVKSRRGTGYGLPAEAITARKRNQLARVALAYLARRGALDAPCRFDVVEVLEDRGGGLRLRHVRDAFRIRPGG